MREIEFRIRYRNGEWFYGVPLTKIKNDTVAFQSFDGNYYDFFADATTLGQYTGLTDKNGKKIFEGDVVKVSGVAKAKIIWNNEDACFAFDYGKDGRPLCLDFIDDTSIEVIGNIYDNPELLEK